MSRPHPAPLPSDPFEMVVSAIEVATGRHRKPSGKGVRCLCPACGGTSYKLSLARGDGNRCLMNCFGCGDAKAVLKSVGLRLADLYPPRHWPQSPQERQATRRARQEAGWCSALEVLTFEAGIVQAAARQLLELVILSEEDYDRLAQAAKRIDNAAEVFRHGR